MKVNINKYIMMVMLLCGALAMTRCSNQTPKQTEEVIKSPDSPGSTKGTTGGGSGQPPAAIPIIVTGIVIDQAGKPIHKAGQVIYAIDAQNDTFAGVTSAACDSAYSIDVSKAQGKITVTAADKAINYLGLLPVLTATDSLDVILNSTLAAPALELELRNHDRSDIPAGIKVTLTDGTTPVNKAVTKGFVTFTGLKRGVPYTFTALSNGSPVSDISGMGITTTFTIPATQPAATTVGYEYFLK